jgi:alkanesulfonate monooxygenase SsuD/methylene tetrahydromethanopterin reductase-like flavin-dependent oxidoreductase (luciferase family)
VRYAVQTWGTDVAALRRYWEAADALGYDVVLYGDGLWPWTHDGWSALGAVAAWTRRVRIGPAVTYCFDVSSHHPSWLAKRAVAIDHLSGGRLDLRLGVGAEAPGVAESWRRHGIDYPRAGTRVALVEETIRILRRLWDGEPVDFAGRLSTLEGARLEPRPLQRPGPPIWLAAMSPRALGVAARHADGWEASYITPVEVARVGAVLLKLLRRAGRDAHVFRRSVEVDVLFEASGADARGARARFAAQRGVAPGDALLDTALCGDAAAVAAQIAAYAAAGATDLTLGFADFPELGMLQRFADHVVRR